MTEPTGNEQLVHAFFATLTTGDLEALRALLRVVIEIRDGMVCHLREYMDTADINSVV